MMQAKGERQNVKKGFFMDKFLIILAGGSFCGLFALLSVLAISIGMVFQGALIGILGLMFSGVMLAMLAE